MKFRVKMMQKNFPDFLFVHLFSFAFEKKVILACFLSMVKQIVHEYESWGDWAVEKSIGLYFFRAASPF